MQFSSDLTVDDQHRVDRWTRSMVEGAYNKPGNRAPAYASPQRQQGGAAVLGLFDTGAGRGLPSSSPMSMSSGYNLQSATWQQQLQQQRPQPGASEGTPPAAWGPPPREAMPQQRASPPPAGLWGKVKGVFRGSKVRWGGWGGGGGEGGRSCSLSARRILWQSG